MSSAHLPREVRRLLGVACCVPLLWLVAGCAATRPPLDAGGELCLAQLSRAKVSFESVTQPAGGSACAVVTPVRVSAAGIAWNQPGVVSCGFALKLDVFAREDVQEAAQRDLGTSVRVIRHFGTYACRREPSGRWSEHALGNAIDIAGFELADGRIILVQRDWHRRGAAGHFLHDVARRACARFGVVLTPDSNRDHYNHIHIDAGPYKLCGA